MMMSNVHYLCALRILVASSLLAAAPILSFSQSGRAVATEEWCRFNAPAKQISVAFPCEGYIVDNNDGAYRLFFESPDNSMTFTFTPSSSALGNFRRNASLSKGGKGKYFSVGDVLVEKIDQESEPGAKTQFVSTWLWLASSAGDYVVYVLGPSDTDTSYSRFLHSVIVNGKPLFKPTETFPVGLRTYSQADLRTDQMVLDALLVPDSKQGAPLPAGYPDPKAVNDDAKTSYSRRMIVLRRPKPENVTHQNGTVMFNVLFKGDGSLGEIRLVKSLNKALEREAFKAVRRLKFIPAQVGGQPADVWRKVEYNFASY